MKSLRVREVLCKTLLHPMPAFTGETEYTANFFRGCCHACAYCYVPSLIHDERPWGSYVDVKTNAPRVLDRELRNIRKRAVVFLSSATDPYQAVEARYRVTRRCLEVLRTYGFPVVILTRSPLILRDIDLLTKLEWLRVGFSISSVSDRFYEPGVPSLERRILALGRLADAGITTWVSLAPVIPALTTMDVSGLLGRLKDAGVKAVSPGLIRFTGYPESRAMFEQRTGVSTGRVEADESGSLERLRGAISARGFEDTGGILRWKEPDEIEASLHMRALDNYF